MDSYNQSHSIVDWDLHHKLKTPMIEDTEIRYIHKLPEKKFPKWLMILARLANLILPKRLVLKLIKKRTKKYRMYFD